MNTPTSPESIKYSRLHPDIKREVRRAADAAGVLYLELFRKKHQNRSVIAARVEVMRFLRNRGFSYPAIGHALGMNHSSVIHHLKHAQEPKREPVPFPDYSGEWAI